MANEIIEFKNSINVSGTVVVGQTIVAGSTMKATNFLLGSDERLKTNIEPIRAIPLNVEYKQFELISEPNQQRYGVIAQDLQKEYPELVRIDENGMLSVAYIDLLIKEIAFLKNKVAELEKRLE